MWCFGRCRLSHSPSVSRSEGRQLDVTAEAALALGIAVDLIALFETCLKTKYSCPGHTRTRTK